jgi:uncharacterized protein YjbJ (UPF0337 family)
MGADEMKGRAKEAVGDVTGDEDLEREGKMDQGADKLKGMVGKAREKIGAVFNRR